MIPTVRVPDLMTLVSGKTSFEDKLQLLLYICGLDLSIESLNSCPSNFIVDAIICAYLVDNKAISAGEAQCLMLSIVNSERSDKISYKYPTKVNSQAFRIGFLYQKLFFMLHSCIAAVGLKIFQV
jgi:hypothetical protein